MRIITKVTTKHSLSLMYSFYKKQNEKNKILSQNKRDINRATVFCWWGKILWEYPEHTDVTYDGKINFNSILTEYVLYMKNMKSGWLTLWTS